MAIEHSLKMKGEMVPIQHFLDYCAEKGIDFDVEDDSSVYLCEWKLWVYFREAGPPYNAWECSTFEHNLIYNATISIRLGNNPDDWQKQNDFVLEYIFRTMREFKREGLFLYCMDTELCYFMADGSLQVNDEAGVLKRIGI